MSKNSGALSRYVATGILLASCLLLAGCRAGYFVKLGYEQALFLARARSIEAELKTSDDARRRRRLQMVLDLREFASRSGLDAGGSYLAVSQIEPGSGVHVVTAAYRERLEAWTWNYPVVGRLPYRGYFDHDDARDYAERLQKRGLDTRVVAAAAYSTLGWFDDPLPSPVLELDEVSMATVILHELVHSTLFVPGKIDFNESLATAVSMRLAQAFFDGRGAGEKAEEVGRRRVLWVERGRAYRGLEERLASWFKTCAQKRCSGEELLAGRSAIYDESSRSMASAGLLGRTRDPATDRNSDLAPMDNAWFLAIYRYHRAVDDFEAWLDGYETTAAALEALEQRVGEGEPFSELEGLVGELQRLAALRWKRGCG